MYERKSRLSPQKRARLIELFITGTRARAAAQLVGVNKNTAATFFTRLRKVIADEMEMTRHSMVRLKSMRAISTESGKANEAEVLPVKFLFSAC